MRTIKQHLKTRGWLLFRILLCAGALASGFSEHYDEGDFNPRSALGEVISASIGILILIPFGFLGRAAFLAFSPSNRNVRWERPDWHSRPFFRNGPNHFFHLCAFTSIANGIGVSAASFMGRTTDLMGSVIPIVIGVSLLIAIRLTALIFEYKYAPLSEDSRTVRVSVQSERIIAGAWLGVYLVAIGAVVAAIYLIYRP